jgi:phosphomannomutase
VEREIFREYDIRGIVGETLDAEGALIFGKGFGTYLSRKGGGSVAVGRDNRLSSVDLQQAVIAGLASTGFQVIDLGQLPTPAFYFSVIHLHTDGGVMVTASHNPIMGLSCAEERRRFLGKRSRKFVRSLKGVILP